MRKANASRRPLRAGATGPAGAGGASVVFVSAGNIAASGDCIANQWLVAAGNDAGCPAAVPADSFTQDAIYLLGPITASGGTISNLEATTSVATVAGVTVDVIDNTTGSTLLSCAFTTGTTSCKNTGSAAVTAGHYVEVKVTDTAKKAYRVSFRY